jgi:hypothetical protein
MILEITPEQVAQLNDTDLRTLVAYLCEREMTSHGHAAAAVTWGGHQNAPDGGIDVRVSLPAGSQISGYVPRPATGFQVKAQTMPASKIKNEMAPDGVLLASIEDLAAKGGAYIIVSSKDSVSNTYLQERLDAMIEAVQGCASAGSLALEFYDSRRIASWVNQHAGLVPWVREKVGFPLSGWRSFEDWSSSPTSLDKPYLLDDHIRLLHASVKDSQGLSAAQGLSALRAILAKPKGVVRLVGLSGVGKTRLIQALFDDRIGNDALWKSDALYTDISDGQEPVPLEMLSRLISLGQKVVMIVDNSPADLHRKLAARIEKSNCLLSLITVEYDINEDEPESTDVFKLEPSSSELVEKLLEIRFPAIAEPSRRTIAKFSDGNARVAFALANTARNGESLANLNDSDLFRRLFEQQKGSNEDLFDAAEACALLYSFDGETLEGTESELVPLAKLAGQTVDQLHKHVAELHRRKLVQKRSKWRAILPHALAYRLAKRALADIPFQRIEDAIINGSSARMLRSFSRRMGYLHDDPKAIALAAKWYADGGLLADLGKLNELGEEILENIAPVDPDATLSYFERAAQKNAESFFAPNNGNKSQIVRITRAIAYDAMFFDRCVDLLKRFALAERGERFNSAAEPLKSLFFLYLSGTHATAAQRAAFIKGCLQSAAPTEAERGVTLLDAMLEADHFTSHQSFEFGAWKRDYGFYPRKGDQIRDWYAQALNVARALGTSDSIVSTAVRHTMASHVAQLLRVGMVDEIVTLADAFHAHGGWPSGWIGVRRAMRMYKEKMPEAIFAKLSKLEERLRPNDLAGMIRSYALSPEWGALDIAELEDDEEDNPIRARERIYEVCNDLGQQLVKDPAQFAAMLPEILLSDSPKTFALGRGFASGCVSLTECWKKLRATFLAQPKEKRRAQTLAGFLMSARTRAPEETDCFFDNVIADPELHPYLVYWLISAGHDTRDFERLMKAAELDTVAVSLFANLASGRAHETLNDEQFGKLMKALTARPDSPVVVTEILGMRVFGIRSDKQPVSELIKTIGRDFLAHIEFGQNSSRLGHMLGQIVEASFDKPEYEHEARAFCGRILAAIKAYRLYAMDIGDVIEALTKVNPLAVLDILVEQAVEDEDVGRAPFEALRSNRPCPLDSIAPDVWLGWAAAKPGTRFAYVAQVIGFSQGIDDEVSKGWSAAAEQIINAAPDPAKVLNVFMERFEPTGGWVGSLADIMASRSPMIEALTHHRRPEVAAWANENIAKFNDRIARKREWETSQNRSRHETFE